MNYVNNAFNTMRKKEKNHAANEVIDNAGEGI